MSDCNNKNRPANILPDRGVKYTGESIPSLGVCTGDYLDDIEDIIIKKIVDYSTGLGISLPDTDFTSCSFLNSFVSCCMEDKSLQGIIDGILKALCSLNTTTSSLQSSVTSITPNYVITPGCLTVANNKIDTVLNALIVSYCSFVDKVTAIFGDLDNPVINNTVISQITDSVITTVFNNIQSCSPQDITKTGTGINTIITVKGQVPIRSFMFGDWDASFFDNTGLGLPSKGLCGWAECNGQNGTPDMRGFTFAMATNIASSVTLNNRVDPVINLDADLATNIGDVRGEAKHLLTGPESALQPHTHPVNDPGHQHKISALKNKASSGNNNGTYGTPNNNVLPDVYTDVIRTGISIGTNASSDALVKHENRQPTVYVNCIQRIF